MINKLKLSSEEKIKRRCRKISRSKLRYLARKLFTYLSNLCKHFGKKHRSVKIRARIGGGDPHPPKKGGGDFAR